MVQYNKSIIYKLCCRNANITEIYIGSTTNFRRRKSGHKTTCNNGKHKAYNFEVYKFIRDNGGFENWDMIEIEKVNATDKKDLEKNERRVIDELKPILNCRIPGRTKKEYYAENADKFKEHKKEYNAKNADKIKEQVKKYYAENADKIKEQQKEYRDKNVDKIKEQQKEYRDKNVDKIKEQQRVWRTDNIDKKKEQQRVYYAENTDKFKEYRANNADKLKEYNKEYYEKNIDKSKQKIDCDCGSTITKYNLSHHAKSKKHIQYLESLENIPYGSNFIFVD